MSYIKIDSEGRHMCPACDEQDQQDGVIIVLDEIDIDERFPNGLACDFCDNSWSN